MAKHQDGTTFAKAVPTLVHITGVSFLFFLSRSAMSPLLLEVEQAFSLSHAAIARAFAVYTIGYGISVFCSGFAARRISFRRLMPIAAVVGVIGLGIVAFSPNVFVLQVGLFVFGVGFGLEAPTAISMIAATVHRPDWQRAMSLHEMSPHLGMILAPIGVIAIGALLDWRGVFWALALLLFVQGGWFFLRVKDGDEYGEAPSIKAIGVLVRRLEFWVLIVFFALALSSTDGIYLLIPTFLIVEGGISPTIANSIFGASRVLPIVALFVSALISDRIGPRWTIVLSVAGAGAVVVLMGTTEGIVRIVTVFLQPTIGALFFPAGFSALAALSPGRSRNVGISMVLPLAVIFGVGVVPALVGQMGDTISFSAGFVILGTTMVIAGISAIFLIHDSPSTRTVSPRR